MVELNIMQNTYEYSWDHVGQTCALDCVMQMCNVYADSVSLLYISASKKSMFFFVLVDIMNGYEYYVYTIENSLFIYFLLFL